MTRRLLAGALTGCLLLLTAACTDSEGTNDGGYIEGDSQVLQISPDQRKGPVELSGETLEGGQLDLAEHRGQVVVVNTWWSGCPPCRTEMPMLVEAQQELADQDVVFVGINIRDASPDQGLAFERALGVDYPSIYAPGGEALLALAGINPRTIPTTVVLDRAGQIAAVVSGPLPGKVTFMDVVEEIAAEGA